MPRNNSKTAAQNDTAVQKTANLNIEVVEIEGLNYGPYQRDEIPAHVARMADRFDNDQFGIPLIGRRRNGSQWVVNGRQRIAAAKEDGFTHVMAIVFNSRGIKQEAEAFITANRSPIKVSGNRLHEARFLAQWPAAIWAETLMEPYDISGRVDTEARHRVTSTGMFYEVYDRLGLAAGLDEATRCADFALNVLTGCYAGEYPTRTFMRKNLFMGLVYAAHNCRETEAQTVVDALDAAGVTPEDFSEHVTNIGNGS